MFIFNDISFDTHKVCFRDFCVSVNDGSHVGIIGRNGCGKSSLLKILHEKLGNTLSYLVPQIISDYPNLSGGERFNKKLSDALSKKPEVLLLDEPTNHLDIHNRNNLIKMLKSYRKILLIATHDLEILKNCIDTIWYINDQKIITFSGNYDSFVRENKNKSNLITKQLTGIKRTQKKIKLKIQKEQEHNAHSKASGVKKIKNKRWMKSVGNAKAMSSEKSYGKVMKNFMTKQTSLLSELDDLFVPEEIIPSFNFACDETNKASVSIANGAIGYSADNFILKDININLDHSLAIIGPNGSGKTTLVKAILDDPLIYKEGLWHAPKNIAYLDQYYSTLNPDLTPIETISKINQHLSHAEIRKYLNNFLFRKNEEINTLNKYLSGGELARLCLAQITLLPPSLLILDEITNNIDMETRNHITNIMKNYKGRFIVISHDMNFLDDINVQQVYETQKN